MNQKNFFLLVFLAVFILFQSACQKTDDPINSATDSRDALEGSWTNAESSKLFGQSTYTVSISKSGSDNETILIKNFYNLGPSTNTIAKVSGSQISIASQQVSSQTIKGSGAFSAGKINWSYVTFDGGAHRDTCSAVSSK